MTKFVNTVRAFAREEDGVALSEYLILLGILVGGVIVAVGLVATDLAGAWTAWGTWFGDNTNPPPAPAP